MLLLNATGYHGQVNSLPDKSSAHTHTHKPAAGPKESNLFLSKVHAHKLRFLVVPKNLMELHDVIHNATGPAAMMLMMMMIKKRQTGKFVVCSYQFGPLKRLISLSSLAKKNSLAS